MLGGESGHQPGVGRQLVAQLLHHQQRVCLVDQVLQGLDAVLEVSAEGQGGQQRSALRVFQQVRLRTQQGLS